MGEAKIKRKRVWKEEKVLKKIAKIRRKRVWKEEKVSKEVKRVQKENLREVNIVNRIIQTDL